MDVSAASAGTGLEAEAILALESDRPHRLTRPPYGEAWRSAYALFLDRVASGETQAPTEGVTEVSTAADTEIDEAVREASPARPPAVPLRAVRVVAGLAALVALGFALWGVRSGLSAPEPPPGEVVVRVVMQRTARLSVSVDGVLREEREFAGREDLTWRGRQQIDVRVPDVQEVKVWFNERLIEPRGRLGVPRTLSFRAGDAP